jgi:hypothetical protein
MSHFTTTIHGTNWTIDTMDWLDSASAESCANLIVKNITKLGKRRVQAAHTAYVSALAADDSSRDDLYNSHDDSNPYLCIRDACCEAANTVMKGWDTRNLTGHNYDAYPA